MTCAVFSELIAGVLPSGSKTFAPNDHNTDHAVVFASPQWLMAIPTGVPCFLSALPCLSSSSHDFGYSKPAFLKCAMLYVAGNEIQNHGTARHPVFVWHASAANGYHPPCSLPSLSTTSPTSAS